MTTGAIVIYHHRNQLVTIALCRSDRCRSVPHQELSHNEKWYVYIYIYLVHAIFFKINFNEFSTIFLSDNPSLIFTTSSHEGRNQNPKPQAYLAGQEPRPELGMFIGSMEMRAFLQVPQFFPSGKWRFYPRRNGDRVLDFIWFYPVLFIPSFSSSSSSSNASCRQQWTLPDLNREWQISACTAGTPPRAPDLSRHSWTLPDFNREWQISWALPDSNFESQISVGTAGAQLRVQDVT